jgi:hypothetical protein
MKRQAMNRALRRRNTQARDMMVGAGAGINANPTTINASLLNTLGSAWLRRRRIPTVLTTIR